MTFSDLQRANAQIVTKELKNEKTGKVLVKDYAEVYQRIKAFRMLYPEGSITTEMLQFNGDTVVMKATVCGEGGVILATGTAYEVKDSNNVNKTSFVENCETSAVGRALAFLGIGIDLGTVAYSAPVKEDPIAFAELKMRVMSYINKSDHTEELVANICEHYRVADINDLNMQQLQHFVDDILKQGKEI